MLSKAKMVYPVLLLTGLFIMQETSFAQKEVKLKRVPDPSYVCMVNNEVMGKPQIPVKVEDKTYYGCCEMCVKTLKGQSISRFATDPVTGQKVDKAKAVIGVKPNGEVLYFENEKTFQRFMGGK